MRATEVVRLGLRNSSWLRFRKAGPDSHGEGHERREVPRMQVAVACWTPADEAAPCHVGASAHGP